MMKAIKRSAIPLFFTMILGVILFSACQKTASSSGDADNFTVYLTDGPGDFSAVNIDIKYVEVKVFNSNKHDHSQDADDDDSIDDNDDDQGDHDGNGDDNGSHEDRFGKWDTLAYTPGVYNLMELRNGVETALGTRQVNGQVKKIRFTLGEGCSVVKDGVTYPLLLAPGNSNRYVYVLLNDGHRHRSGSNVSVWVDFDLSKSIVEYNGKYYLKPVLKPFCDKNYASVEGVVLPEAARSVVIVYNDKDRGVAVPWRDGRFKVRALKPGTYTVKYTSLNGYAEKIVEGVVVKAGETTKLPSVTLVK